MSCRILERKTSMAIFKERPINLNLKLISSSTRFSSLTLTYSRKKLMRPDQRRWLCPELGLGTKIYSCQTEGPFRRITRLCFQESCLSILSRISSMHSPICSSGHHKRMSQGFSSRIGWWAFWGGCVRICWCRHLRWCTFWQSLMTSSLTFLTSGRPLGCISFLSTCWCSISAWI